MHFKRVREYMRGSGVTTQHIKDKKLKGMIEVSEKAFGRAARSAAIVESLLPDESGYMQSEGFERTYNVSQTQLKSMVDLNTSKNIYCLDLDEFGPYSPYYSRNGRWMVLGGSKGHIALLDCLRMRVKTEVHLKVSEFALKKKKKKKSCVYI